MRHYIIGHVENGHTYLNMQVEGAAPHEISNRLINKSVECLHIHKRDDLSSCWRVLIEFGSGEMLEVSASETEVVDWNEIGTINLAFRPGGVPVDAAIYKRLAVDPFVVNEVELLTCTEDLVFSECGILLKGLAGEIFIVAIGEMPFQLSVSLHSSNNLFLPRYPVESCAASKPPGASLIKHDPCTTPSPLTD
ncbi:hypothetical protein SFA35_16785 [Pseudomonas sp. HR96]|uniref:hypothetical protein n=1 Tax=Pseudomonas sp. HR96 TaxID=1027966 RepID=UPI002A752E22|nr:hypothetical protein [Pseudomonas sp. HR96]WPO98295.1 hypothetical protein SFA35_16785 [Pseudomonas sp. HR96]